MHPPPVTPTYPHSSPPTPTHLHPPKMMVHSPKIIHTPPLAQNNVLSSAIRAKACQHGLHAHVPTSHLYVSTNKCANVPKLCQLFNLACQHFKGVPIFQIRLPKGFFKRTFQLSNFSIMLNICKFQKYLGNSRKLISLNKET